MKLKTGNQQNQKLVLCKDQQNGSSSIQAKKKKRKHKLLVSEMKEGTLLQIPGL